MYWMSVFFLANKWNETKTERGKTGVPGSSRNLSEQPRTPTVTNPTHISPLVLAIRTLTPWVCQRNISCKSCNWISANCRERQYFLQCIWKTEEGRTVQCFGNWQWGSIDKNAQWSVCCTSDLYVYDINFTYNNGKIDENTPVIVQLISKA